MTRDPAGWDVDSQVQAEVFVVWLDGDRIHNMEATREEVVAVLLGKDPAANASA